MARKEITFFRDIFFMNCSITCILVLDLAFIFYFGYLTLAHDMAKGLC